MSLVTSRIVVIIIWGMYQDFKTLIKKDKGSWVIFFPSLIYKINMERSVLAESASLNPVSCSKSSGKQPFAPLESATDGVWPWEVQAEYQTKGRGGKDLATWGIQRIRWAIEKHFPLWKAQPHDPPLEVFSLPKPKDTPETFIPIWVICYARA